VCRANINGMNFLFISNSNQINGYLIVELVIICSNKTMESLLLFSLICGLIFFKNSCTVLKNKNY